MSGSFAELMKVAQANTLHANREALEAAKRRELAIRKQREEQEKKEREEKELQKKLMLKRLEDQKKDEERRKQKEDDVKKRREEAQKKKEQEAEAARYAPNAASSSGSSSKGKSSHSYIVTNAAALTREEKRMMKDPLFADQVRARNAALKKRKDGRLPGGAIIGESTSGPSTSRNGSPSMSARARVAMNFPPTLMKLNTEKRDTRSIDEISRDLKKKGQIDDKVTLSGEQATSFSDWFGKKPSGPPSPAPPSRPKKNDVSASKSAYGVPQRNSGFDSKERDLQRSQSLKGQRDLAGSSKSAGSSRPLVGKSSNPALSSVPAKRARGRSSSLDEDSMDEDSEDDRRYAKKKSSGGGGLQDNMRDMIWKLMGKDRSRYANNAIDSDEDDMEVTGAELEREERISARLARKEDAEAEAEEKRRELEKKRRKMDKDRGARK
ncbi:hypothetical protein FRC03_006652 [Tulasnella sp. 419]|nr:hypothetical protein FRC02_012244 [Tulasnella sp. 418]KAG8970523.1 hypothetical protein FRC03_006652 [Tulasnella sp. 419]